MKIFKIILRVLIAPFIFLLHAMMLIFPPFALILPFGLLFGFIYWITNGKSGEPLDIEMTFSPLYLPFYATYIWIMRGETLS